jgi:hypothetical protein
MIKNDSPPSLLRIFLVLLFCACSNEDIETSATPSVVSLLKNDLKLNQFAKKNFETNTIVNWDAFRIEKEGTIYEIPITEINHYYKIGFVSGAIKNKGGEMHSYLIEAFLV